MGAVMKRVIDFAKLRYPALLFSLVLAVVAIFATVSQGGYNLGIDFQAGLSQRIRVVSPSTGVTAENIRTLLSELDPGVQVQNVGPVEAQEFSIRIRDRGAEETKDFSVVMSAEVVNRLNREYDEIQEQELSYVGPRFSEDLTRQAFLLVFLALGLILIYIWVRFQLGYAVSAIAALMHDVVLMLGFIGAVQIEVSTATIAAVLTIIGYSLNDTIVIFDRVRENEGLLRDSTFPVIINASITQSLGRTVITSVTTFLAVASIYVFAVGPIRDFALNMMVGIVVGTYSSIFVASPVLLMWRNAVTARRKKKEYEKYRKGAVSGSSPRSDAPSIGKAASQQVTSTDLEAVKKEIEQKQRQAVGTGKNVSRAKRKGKK
jgi:preprotein translocase subunit SecF